MFINLLLFELDVKQLHVKIVGSSSFPYNIQIDTSTKASTVWFTQPVLQVINDSLCKLKCDMEEFTSLLYKFIVYFVFEHYYQIVTSH